MRPTRSRYQIQAPPSPQALAEFTQAHRFASPLARASLAYLLLTLGLVLAGWLTRPPLDYPSWAVMRDELVQGGLLGASVAALLLAFAGLLLTSRLTQARQATLAPAAPKTAPLAATAPRRFWQRLWQALRTLLTPRPKHRLPPISRAAWWPQAILLLVVLALAAIELHLYWPMAMTAPLAPASSCFVLGGAACVLAFPLLIAERYFAGIQKELLPEAPALKALLFVPVLMLPLAGLMEIGAGLGFAWVYWLRLAVAIYLAILTGELALRTLAVFFQPAPQPHAARAAIESLAATLLRPASISPTAFNDTIRERFGIDFSRSWALVFVKAAAAPVLLVMLVFSWGLTGITDIGLQQRGVYERFGAPVEVMKPGMHLALPWPFGRVRLVDYGVLRSVAVGYSPPDMGTDMTKAEDIPPPSADRLWDAVQGTEADYLIASRAGDRESFETVNADLRVIYRVGLDDASAKKSLYAVTDPQMLVSSTTGRLLARFFASQTLTGVLGENREAIANELQSREQAELDRLGSGIEVVSMMIETIHPPSGAADAYHNVQAAEIVADTSIAEERGRAQSVLNVAQQQAREATNQAGGNAADNLAVANAALTNFTADETGYRTGGKNFLTERYLTNLRTALTGASIEIVDDRLQQPNLPIIDLRPPMGLGTPIQEQTQ